MEKSNLIGKLLICLNAGEIVQLNSAGLTFKYDRSHMDDFRIGHSGRQYVRYGSHWLDLSEFTVEILPAKKVADARH